MTRIQVELDAIEGKIRRQLGHLEAEDPGSRAGVALRDRLRELADLRLKKERQLGAQKRAAAARPSLKTASSLLELLPITVVDINRMGKDAFRELLKILSFEGSFEPNGRFLDVSVMLLPELAAEDGPFTRVLSVPPTGFEPVLPP